MEDKIRILMIDDEKDFLESMSFWLKSRGYDVTTAAGGEEGLKAINKNKPDVVLLDIFMPETNGVEVLGKIRKIDRNIPVIMLTVAELNNIEKAYSIKDLNELKISGFFKKTDSFEELTKLLKVALMYVKK